MARLAFFDVHCHLQDSRIAHCAPLLLKQASEAGVRWFAVNGTSEEDWADVKEMSQTHSNVIPNFGLHPWWIPGRSPKWSSVLREMLEANPTAAVGEIGLDLGKRGREIDEALQLEILKEQLTIAREFNRPASIHNVRAIDPLQKLLAEMGNFPAGLIMHSFVGPADAVRGLAKHGAYFSFSGFITPLKETKARAILEQVPQDRILLETDTPDALPKVESKLLFPVPGDPASHSGDESVTKTGGGDHKSCCSGKIDGRTKVNESEMSLNHPGNITAVLKHVSSLMGISEEELSSLALENARRIFSFPGSKISC
ncbi:hypothetical protein R1flu_006266 [Riccia fluitans]|uniref:TatD related DNase n=1 Tax=Riccia fluitans TaxID=41844 RepID=A0ABD1YVI6_9MARC